MNLIRKKTAEMFLQMFKMHARTPNIVEKQYTNTHYRVKNLVFLRAMHS